MCTAGSLKKHVAKTGCTAGAKLIKGFPPSRELFICPARDCEEGFDTIDEAWAHAESNHGIEKDKNLCLWDQCGKTFREASQCTRHLQSHMADRVTHACTTCSREHVGTTQANQCCLRTACHCGWWTKGHLGKRALAPCPNLKRPSNPSSSPPFHKHHHNPTAHRPSSLRALILQRLSPSLNPPRSSSLLNVVAFLCVAGELQKHQAEGCNAGARLLLGKPVAKSDDDL